MPNALPRALLTTFLIAVLALPACLADLYVLCVAGDGHVEVEVALLGGRCLDTDAALEPARSYACIACNDFSWEFDDGILTRGHASDQTGAIHFQVPADSPAPCRIPRPRPVLYESAPLEAEPASFLRSTILII